MIIIVFSVLLGCIGTVGFVKSIIRKPLSKPSFTEWFLSAEVGFLIGVSFYSLVH